MKSKKVESDIFKNTCSGRETSRFTAKELDTETALYYYGARYLDPRTSRWISSDPAGFELINPNQGTFSMIEANNWYSYVANNPVRFRDPTGMEIDDVIFAQHQNSQTNASASPGGSETGYYDRNGNYQQNTIGRYGCLFTAAVNIGNTYKRNQYTEMGVPSSYNTNTQVSTMAQNGDYFAFWLSGENSGTDFGTGSSHISKLLADMTGQNFDVSRNRDSSSSQQAIKDFALSKTENASIIADVGGHFINVTGWSEEDGLQYHDPYIWNNTPNYTLDDVKGIYLIQEQE